MKKIIVVLICFLSFQSSVLAQADKEYTKLLQKMLESAGNDGAYKSAITQIIGMYKAADSSIPDDFWNSFEKEFSAKSYDDLIEKLAPVYAKYLTKEDLKQLNDFYQTPVGKKYAKVVPNITMDSMEIGKAWGQEIAMKVLQKLEEKKK